MRSIFSLDGPLYKFFGTFANLVILNLIAILCSLPLITAGASFTALHYVTFKMVRSTDDHIVRQFFKAFKDNIKQGIILWIVPLLLIAATGFVAYLLKYSPDSLPRVFLFAFFAGLFVVLLVTVWVFPLLMHFAYPRTTDYIRNAFLLSLSHLPRTLLMAAITALPIFFAYIEPFRSAVWLLAIGFSLPVWLKSWLYNSVFKKLEPPEEEEEDSEEDGEDKDEAEKADDEGEEKEEYKKADGNENEGENQGIRETAEITGKANRNDSTQNIPEDL